MKKNSLIPYLLILFLLLLFMSLPISFVESFRGRIIAWVSPILFHKKENIENQELVQLHLENHLLRNEISQLTELLHLQMKDLPEAVPARVIYRSLSSWNSSLWINVGEEDNHQLRRDIILKNSPVTLGTAVVGVIDYVGKHQSRVRLITDTGLTPSVRAVREVDGELRRLAKGELHGSSHPLWRSQAQILHGSGFNYDFPDEFGPARDLRTGFPFNADQNATPISLIQPNDLLITTGMDGVFPSDLHVATILEITPLKEGDYTCSLTARPVVDNLDDLSLVFVIAPIGFDPSDRAPHIIRD